MYKIRLFGFNSNYSYFFDESVETWHNICLKCVGDKKYLSLESKCHSQIS